jgi:hypothetical protein
MMKDHWWNDNDRGKPKNLETQQRSVLLPTVSTTNASRNGLGLNTGLRGEMPVTKSRRHNAAYHINAGIFVLRIISVHTSQLQWIGSFEWGWSFASAASLSTWLQSNGLDSENVPTPSSFWAVPYIKNPFQRFAFTQDQRNILPIFSTIHTSNCIVAIFLFYTFTLTFLKSTRPKFFFSYARKKISSYFPWNFLQTMPWFIQLDAVLLTCKTAFNPSPVYVKYVLVEVTLGLVLSHNFRFPPLSLLKHRFFMKHS